MGNKDYDEPEVWGKLDYYLLSGEWDEVDYKKGDWDIVSTRCLSGATDYGSDWPSFSEIYKPDPLHPDNLSASQQDHYLAFLESTFN